MQHDDPYLLTGEELVRQDIITREELDEVKANEITTGTPWYKQLIQQRRISFDTLDNVLHYEFHSRAAKTAPISLGESLVSMGHLTEAELDEALEEQKRSGRLLGNILLEKKFVTREAMAHALAKQYNMEYACLRDTPSTAEALLALPEPLALQHKIIPISLTDDTLVVLAVHPQTRERLKEVGVILGTEIKTFLTAVEDIEEEIKKRYAVIVDQPAPKDDRGLQKQVIAKEAVKKEDSDNEAQPVESDRDVRFEEIAQAAAGASVVQIVSMIIEGAINAGATDIHIDPQLPESRVRYRIDAMLHDVMRIPESLYPSLVSRIKIISDLDITDTRHPQDGHISLALGDREIDIRVATLPTYLGERVVLRLLDQSSVLSGIKDLGLSDDDEKTLNNLIKQPYGMILVTGPTGSGKTTTLYAALNQKNVMTESIVTLEDPVEYQLAGINQVQIDPEINVTFANTLRAAMRQDIDVLLVGEIRDPETAQIAIRAAMTGHLVFSTLHTNDAIEAISTLRNMGIPAFLIATALTAVIGQRLVRKICPACKYSFFPTDGLLQSIDVVHAKIDLYRGKGCQRCHFTGFSGRTGIFEVFEITAKIRHLIETEATAEKIMEAESFSTMADHCREKILAGIVNPEEYLRVVRI